MGTFNIQDYRIPNKSKGLQDTNLTLSHTFDVLHTIVKRTVETNENNRFLTMLLSSCQIRLGYSVLCRYDIRLSYRNTYSIRYLLSTLINMKI